MVFNDLVILILKCMIVTNTKDKEVNKLTMSTTLNDDMTVVDPEKSSFVKNETTNWFFNDKFKEEGYYVYDTKHLLNCGKQIVFADDILFVNTIDWEHPIVEFNNSIKNFECKPCTVYLIRCRHFGAYKKFKSLKWLSIVDALNKIHVDLYDASVEIGLYYSDTEINDPNEIAEYVSFKNWALLIKSLKLTTCTVEDNGVCATSVWTPLENDQFIGDYYIKSVEPLECLSVICNKNNTEITFNDEPFDGNIEKYK